jgi:hypothetical protein
VSLTSWLLAINSDGTSSDELSKFVAPSLPAAECVPIKRQHVSQRVQIGRKRKYTLADVVSSMCCYDE